MKKILAHSLCLFVAVLLIPGITMARDYSGKKVLYIDSYHSGYPWSDGIMKGVKNVLDNTGAELKVVHMDTKRNNSKEFMQQAVLQAKTVIEAFHPDVVIVSDDNASKYLVMPYYKDAKLPFVFCGVNWDASGYGFPYSNVTGMVEVNAIPELVELLKQSAKGDRVGFLGEDTLTDRKEVEHYEKILHRPIIAYYASGFADWKKGFLELQDKVDILINYNFASFKDWDGQEAATFVQKHGKIPSGAFQEEAMPHTLVGYLKIPEEQGEWAAQTALKILDGASPASIPITRNQKGKLIVNLKLAAHIHAEIPYEVIQVADSVIE